MPEFTIERHAMTGDVTFSGSVKGGELKGLWVQLDPFDRRQLDSPAVSIADHLLDLELVFRRLGEQRPEGEKT